MLCWTAISTSKLYASTRAGHFLGRGDGRSHPISDSPSPNVAGRPMPAAGAPAPAAAATASNDFMRTYCTYYGFWLKVMATTFAEFLY